MKEYIVNSEEECLFYEHDELIRCKDCKKWKRNDGTLPDFDGKEWHGCKELETFTSKIWNETEPVTPSWFYCGYAEREERD